MTTYPLRRAAIAALALVLAGPACVGRQGRDLPPNVGLSHAPSDEAREVSPDEADAQPMPVGTTVWANFHDTGFFFPGVVIDRREEEHRVLYADGSSEWVGAAALRPDAIGEDAEVHVRGVVGGEYAAGRVRRRLGEALYVHLLGGEDVWTALPHVRFARGAEGTPAVGDVPTAPPPVEAPAPGARVLVNYQSQRLLFAGVVTAVDDDGRLHVVYLDGETEWVAPELVRADALREGDEVHVRRTWEPPEWVPGRIRRRVGHAFEVELRDGGRTWTSQFRIRAPIGGAAPADAAAAAAADADADADADEDAR